MELVVVLAGCAVECGVGWTECTGSGWGRDGVEGGEGSEGWSGMVD